MSVQPSKKGKVKIAAAKEAEASKARQEAQEAHRQNVASRVNTIMGEAANGFIEVPADVKDAVIAAVDDARPRGTFYYWEHLDNGGIRVVYIPTMVNSAAAMATIFDGDFPAVETLFAKLEETGEVEVHKPAAEDDGFIPPIELRIWVETVRELKHRLIRISARKRVWEWNENWWEPESVSFHVKRIAKAEAA